MLTVVAPCRLVRAQTQGSGLRMSQYHVTARHCQAPAQQCAALCTAALSPHMVLSYLHWISADTLSCTKVAHAQYDSR